MRYFDKNGIADDTHETQQLGPPDSTQHQWKYSWRLQMNYLFFSIWDNVLFEYRNDQSTLGFIILKNLSKTCWLDLDY